MIDRKYQYKQSTVKLIFGDILSSQAEVLVSSDDSQLSMGGGVSRHIAEAAGEQYIMDAAKHPPLKLGDVAVTSAGKLKQKYIFHCVTIDFNTKDQTQNFQSIEEYYSFIIQQSVDKCFRLMQSINLSSIAFPLIGSGVAGIPFVDVAQLMASSFARNLQKTNKALTIELYLYNRFESLSQLDYIPVFEQFAIHSILCHSSDLEEQSEETTSESIDKEQISVAPMNHTVFISHSSKDKEAVKKITTILEENNISYWIDKDGMHSKGSFKGVLVDAIDAAKVVIFLSSKSSNASPYVIKEIGIAVNHRKMIIPIVLDGCAFAKEIEFDLQDIDRLDFYGNFEQKMLKNIKFGQQVG